MRTVQRFVEDSSGMNREPYNQTEYAATADFCHEFHSGMSSLYQLAFLLAADHHTAERIFVAGLEECLNGNPVFKERVSWWSKRAIVTNAIRVMTPISYQAADVQAHEESGLASRSRTHETAITRLSTFTRFVFVMTVLERFSVSECAILLGATRKDVLHVQSRAMVAIALGDSSDEQSESMETCVSARQGPTAQNSQYRIETEYLEVSA